MIDLAAAPPRHPFFAITGPKLRVWPILLAAALMQACLVPARELARWIYKANSTVFDHQVWAFVGLAMLFQTASALIAIAAMHRLLPEAPTYLRRPEGKSLAGLAMLIGLLMGVVMLVADYWPQLLARTAPDGGYDVSPVGASGWLFVMGVTGFCEEPLFRGLLVGMLTVLTPGRIRLGAFEIPVAGVIVALLFGIAHYDAFLRSPLHLAVAQQVYAFVWGVTYVWLMERSKSLLAPIIAHGVGDAVEVAAVMALMKLWG